RDTQITVILPALTQEGSGESRAFVFARSAGTRSRRIALRCQFAGARSSSSTNARPLQNAKLAQLTHGRNRHLFNHRRGGLHALGGRLLSPSTGRRYSGRDVSARRTSRRRAASSRLPDL